MKNKTCQSCGMPLENPKLYGTDFKGAPIEDYCMYCFKDGQFVQDVTMDEMIQLCAKFVNGNTREIAIANMKQQFPSLRRWARKEDTQHEYHKSINKVLDYIQNNLNQNTDLKTLAQMANLSSFHFQRIFKATIGESLAAYVQRLKLEKVAELLKSSDLNLSELAEHVGYSNEQALSRAFKKYYNLPPKVFKTSFFNLSESQMELLNPRIYRIAEKNIIWLREPKKDGKDWYKLYTYAIMKQIFNESSETLDLIEQSIYYPSITTNQLQKADAIVNSKVIHAGLYAIFTHKGPVSQVSELYHTILDQWLPDSKYRLRNESCFIIYLNSLTEVTEENLLSEIYLPVWEK